MIPTKIDINSLFIFYLVASEGSITSAAEKLYLTQPTVSYHIKSLENHVGVKLVEIKRQKLMLTQAGTGLFQYAKEIYRQVVSAEEYIQELKEVSLRVGMSATFSPVIAAAAASFEELFPQVKLIAKSASTSEIIEDVLNSRVDVGIVVGSDHKNPRLDTVFISEKENLILVAAPSCPIARKNKVELADLCGYPLVAGPQGSATRQLIIKKCEDAGFKMPTLMTEVNSLEWGISLVESGKGIGLYHTRAVDSKINKGSLKELPLEQDITVSMEAIVRADAPPHPWVGKFVPILKAQLKTRAVLSTAAGK